MEIEKIVKTSSSLVAECHREFAEVLNSGSYHSGQIIKKEAEDIKAELVMYSSNENLNPQDTISFQPATKFKFSMKLSSSIWSSTFRVETDNSNKYPHINSNNHYDNHYRLLPNKSGTINIAIAGSISAGLACFPENIENFIHRHILASLGTPTSSTITSLV